MSRGDPPRLTVGAFQFRGSGDTSQNAAALERGIREAAAEGVRLLATQECALSGYAPIEVESPAAVDREGQRKGVQRVQKLAAEHQMFVALGMTTFGAEGARNSVRLVTPDGGLRRPYHKRALYGWDETNYSASRGSSGIHMVDEVRVGLRICYEVRFPEYFRELFDRRVELAVVSFADTGAEEKKYEVVRSHLVSRAAENAMYVLSANSVSGSQGAPSCLVDPDGRILGQAPRDREALIVGSVPLNPPSFGRLGRIKHSARLRSRADPWSEGIRKTLKDN